MSARNPFPTRGLTATYCCIGTAFAIGFGVCASAAPAFASEEQIEDVRVASVCWEDLLEEDAGHGQRSGCAGMDPKETPRDSLRENPDPLADLVALMGKPSNTRGSHEQGEELDQDLVDSSSRSDRHLPRRVSLGYALYDDSDDNRRSTRSLSTDMAMGDVVWNGYLAFAEAEDGVRDHEAIILGSRIDSPMGKRMNVAGGVGRKVGIASGAQGARSLAGEGCRAYAL